MTLCVFCFLSELDFSFTQFNFLQWTYHLFCSVLLHQWIIWVRYPPCMIVWSLEAEGFFPSDRPLRPYMTGMKPWPPSAVFPSKATVMTTHAEGEDTWGIGCGPALWTTLTIFHGVMVEMTTHHTGVWMNPEAGEGKLYFHVQDLLITINLLVCLFICSRWEDREWWKKIFNFGKSGFHLVFTFYRHD